MSESRVKVKSTTATELLDSMLMARQTLGQSGSISPEQLDQQIHTWQLALVDLIGDTVQGAELATLYEIIGVMNSSLDLAKTLGLVMDSLIHLTGAERGCLMLLDEENNLEIQAAQHFDQETVDAFDMKLSHTVVREAIKKRQPVLTTNAQRDPRFSDQASVIGYHLRSIICVPLHIREQVTGALYLDNRMRDDVFSQQDLPILTAFASQAAIAIENARLYTMTNQALTARKQELMTLQQIDRELNANLDIQVVLNLILSWAMWATDAEKGTLSILDNDGAIESISHAGDKMAEPPPDIVQLAMRSQGPCVIGGRRMLVPIRYENRTMALLDLRHKTNERFQPNQTQFAGRLADHIAIAIKNARLHEQVHQYNQSQTDAVAFIAHKLRTPMTSIRGYADMMAKNMFGPLTPEQMEFTNTIMRNTEKMHILVTDMQDITRLESDTMRPETMAIDLADVLENAQLHTQEQIENRSQQLVVELPENLPRVRANPGQLERVLTELLRNACKYTPDKGQIHVQAHYQNECMHCTVSDNGIGISKKDQAHLFDKFFRSADPMVQEIYGTGLGLCVVKGLVEQQGGKFEVESQLGEGTACTFTMPVAQAVEAKE